MFREDNGNLSSMRIMVFLIVLTALVNWTITNVMAKQITPMDPTLITLIFGSLGLKVGQKAVEKKKDANKDEVAEALQSVMLSAGFTPQKK